MDTRRSCAVNYPRSADDNPASRNLCCSAKGVAYGSERDAAGIGGAGDDALAVRGVGRGRAPAETETATSLRRPNAGDRAGLRGDNAYRPRTISLAARTGRSRTTRRAGDPGGARPWVSGPVVAGVGHLGGLACAAGLAAHHPKLGRYADLAFEADGQSQRRPAAVVCQLAGVAGADASLVHQDLGKGGGFCGE